MEQLSRVRRARELSAENRSKNQVHSTLTANKLKISPASATKPSLNLTSFDLAPSWEAIWEPKNFPLRELSQLYVSTLLNTYSRTHEW